MIAAYTILSVAIAYLLGSIPTGYLTGRIAKGVDVRDLGDRYTGAKNVFREIGPVAGMLTLAGDLLKGFVATLQVNLMGIPELAIIPIALAVVGGHIWPVFLRFRGGAGFATAIGVVFAALPREALILSIPFAAMAWLFRGGPRLGPASGLLLPVLLALSWWLDEPLPRIVVPVFMGVLVSARVYRDELGVLKKRILGT